VDSSSNNDGTRSADFGTDNDDPTDCDATKSGVCLIPVVGGNKIDTLKKLLRVGVGV
jgi:hypothetical protein